MRARDTRFPAPTASPTCRPFSGLARMARSRSPAWAGRKLTWNKFIAESPKPKATAKCNCSSRARMCAIFALVEVQRTSPPAAGKRYSIPALCRYNIQHGSGFRSDQMLSTTVGKEVLFVDDEPAIRATLPVILRRYGYKVTVAATVAEALEAIRKQRFDILISDLNIGHRGDGYTVVQAM